METLPAAADSKALPRESKILALGGDSSCQGNSDKQRSRPQAAAGPCPTRLQAAPRRLPAGPLRRQQSRPQAAAGPCPEDSDAAPRAAPAGRPGARKRGSPRSGQRRPILPRASPSVLSAMEGLTAGFGMGPGVPPPPWPLTRPGAPANRLSRAGTLAASIARKTHIDP